MRHSIIYLSLMACLISACDDGATLSAISTADDNGMGVGDAIAFTTLVPDLPTGTRSAKEDWTSEVASYKAVNSAYQFTIEMWKEGATEAASVSQYCPAQTTANAADNDGTLTVKEGATPLYWQDNVSAWGFKATAGTATIATDQSDQEKWLAQDQLIGYGYLPVWDATLNENPIYDDYLNLTGYEGAATYTLDGINYRTSKQWYAEHKAVLDNTTPQPVITDNGVYKKIPLYLRHQRSWLTIILKAGEGVSREALNYAISGNITPQVYSYTDDENPQTTVIGQPWRREELVNYTKDKNGPAATGVSSTRYDAIIEPHNYLDGDNKEQPLARFTVNNQTFSFAAVDDDNYDKAYNEEDAAALQAMREAYELKAGKHLTLTVTLSRESRKIRITAWVEDWTETRTSTICDDYGQNGDPVQIKTRQDLVAFLSDEKKNKAGNVAIIVPDSLDLEQEGIVSGSTTTWTEKPWETPYDLNATLNLAGAKLITGHQIFKEITLGGNVVNGTISVAEEANVPYVLAKTNLGTLESVSLINRDNSRKATATVAGVVGTNKGTIYNCRSEINVMGATGTGYVGGIAAQQELIEGTLPVIDACVVDAYVDGAEGVRGGGIVGLAEGQVTNNVFEYGITLNQNGTNFKNIFAEKTANTTELHAYQNAWPTTAINPIGTDLTTNVNTRSQSLCYDAVINKQKELETLLTSLYNQPDKRYRISDNFTVSASTGCEGWKYGEAHSEYQSSDEHNRGNVIFELNGNNKTITLAGDKEIEVWSGVRENAGEKTIYRSAPMLFSNIMNKVYDLNIYLEQSLVAKPNSSVVSTGQEAGYDATEAIAPLAWAVVGKCKELPSGYVGGSLENVKVNYRRATETTESAFIQASTPAGLVVWAYGNAVIKNCEVTADVRMWLPPVSADNMYFAGGIVACASIAEISSCVFHSAGRLTYASTHATGQKCFYGGILGGVVMNSHFEVPKAKLCDNTSYFVATATNADESKNSKGSILGSAVFLDKHSTDSRSTTGTDDGNVGNWWPAGSLGVGYRLTSSEKAIGACNTMNPQPESTNN